MSNTGLVGSCSEGPSITCSIFIVLRSFRNFLFCSHQFFGVRLIMSGMQHFLTVSLSLMYVSAEALQDYMWQKRRTRYESSLMTIIQTIFFPSIYTYLCPRNERSNGDNAALFSRNIDFIPTT